MYYNASSPSNSYKIFLHKIKCFHQDASTPKSKIQRIAVEKEKNSHFKKFSVAPDELAISVFPRIVLSGKCTRKYQMDTN